MPEIRLRETDYFEVALRRFKKAVEKAGIINDVRERESYEKPTTKRKRKKIAAIKRNYKRMRLQTLVKKAR